MPTRALLLLLATMLALAPALLTEGITPASIIDDSDPEGIIDGPDPACKPVCDPTTGVCLTLLCQSR